MFFGSDSAPHPQSAKECAHCASGVFSSPIALQIVTEWFMSERTRAWWQQERGQILTNDDVISRLQCFLSNNGELLYGRSLIEKSIILEKAPFTIPESYPTTIPDLSIVPMWAGREIGWKIVEG